MDQQLIQQLRSGDVKTLARTISLLENETENYGEILRTVIANDVSKVVGVTGPPGAGKSTLVDAIIGEFIQERKRVAVLCVDPSSPFNLGALLGDRIRMSAWYTHPNVFIRSLASRGSVGGLSPKIIEITDVLRLACFDYIIVETVGVGQSEIEIAGLADTTVVVMVPESGDEIQAMKAGLMEIADIVVINKSDRPEAELFQKNLRTMTSTQKSSKPMPIVKTVATEKKGMSELMQAIYNSLHQPGNDNRRLALLTDKAWQLLVQKKMRGVKKVELRERIENEYKSADFNLYAFVDQL